MRSLRISSLWERQTLALPAILLGSQQGGVFYGNHIAHDPAWATHGPGIVLSYRVVEDLYAWQTPDVYDLGYGDMAYKHVFGNHVRDVGNVSLVRKGVSTGLALSMTWACTQTSQVVRAALDRMHLREEVRRLLRGRAQPAPLPE